MNIEMLLRVDPEEHLYVRNAAGARRVPFFSGIFRSFSAKILRLFLRFPVCRIYAFLPAGDIIYGTATVTGGRDVS